VLYHLSSVAARQPQGQGPLRGDEHGGDQCEGHLHHRQHHREHVVTVNPPRTTAAAGPAVELSRVDNSGLPGGKSDGQTYAT
jgi:hypothetical protein